jgi:hypothetical protein
MLITPALAFGRLLGQRLGEHLGTQASSESDVDLLARPSEQPPAQEAR